MLRAEALQGPTKAAAARVAATLQEQSVAQQRERMRKADQIILLALQQVGRVSLTCTTVVLLAGAGL